jgi:hypothetical protein
MNERISGGSIGGALGDTTLDSHLNSLEADLRENGMSSVVFDSARLNRRSFGPTSLNDLIAASQRNILGLSSNDDMGVMIAESIGFRPIDLT